MASYSTISMGTASSTDSTARGDRQRIRSSTTLVTASIPPLPTIPKAAAGIRSKEKPKSKPKVRAKEKSKDKPQGEASRKEELMQNAAELRELAAVYEAKVKEEEARIVTWERSLKERLGTALALRKQQENIKIKGIVESWSRDCGGKGAAVSKMAFRKIIRKTIDEPDVNKIDALFDELDTNNGGSLDAVDLTAGMELMCDAAEAQLQKEQRLRERIPILRSRVSTALEVANKTAAAEEIDAKLAEFKRGGSLKARLGAACASKGLKIGNVVSSWETTEGKVNLGQFCTNVRVFFPDASFDECDLLFASLDLDGGGTLDMDEIDAALVTLREAAFERDAEVAKLRETAASLWKAAKSAQAEFKRIRDADIDEEAKAMAKDESPFEYWARRSTCAGRRFKDLGFVRSFL